MLLTHLINDMDSGLICAWLLTGYRLSDATDALQWRNQNGLWSFLRTSREIFKKILSLLKSPFRFSRLRKEFVPRSQGNKFFPSGVVHVLEVIFFSFKSSPIGKEAKYFMLVDAFLLQMYFYLYRTLRMLIRTCMRNVRNERNACTLVSACINAHCIPLTKCLLRIQGPVVQSVVSLTSSLRVISLTILADSIYSILIFFLLKKCE